MTIQSIGPGGVSNSYGTRLTRKPTLGAQSGASLYNGFSSQVPNVDIAPPILFATFGDSLSDTSTHTSFDLRSIPASATGIGMRAERIGVSLQSMSGGRLIQVANCGIGGSGSDTMVLRDGNAAAEGRKALADAAATGASVLLVTMGRNDIFNVITAASTPAQQRNILNTIYQNTKLILERASQLFPYVVYRAMGGYAWSEDTVRNYARSRSFTQEDVATQVKLIKEANDYIRDVLIPGLPFKVTFADVRTPFVDKQTGAWLPGMTLDGLHESPEGGQKMAQEVLVPLILNLVGYPNAPLKYCPKRSGVEAVSSSVQPVMAVVGGGYATGFNNIVSGLGTISASASVVELEGTRWQQIIYTPQTFNGVARLEAPDGYADAQIRIDFPIYGASAPIQVRGGDLVIPEFDIVIDDGNGGAPTNVLKLGVEQLIQHTGGSYVTLSPIIRSTGANNDLYPCSQVIRQKVVGMAQQVQRDSADLANAFIRITATCGKHMAPFRVLITHVGFQVVPQPRPFVGETVKTLTAASYAITNNDRSVFHDVTAANAVDTLPTLATAFVNGYGQKVLLKKTDATANTLTLKGNGAELIDSANTLVLSAAGALVEVQATATKWVVTRTA